MKQWYEITNKAESESVDILVYGQIVSGSRKWDESDVVAQDFIKAIEGMGDKKTINLYINSPGGSVFTAAGIIAILERTKEKGVTINAYIDGVAASAASFLAMAAHNVYVYDTSMLMIHRASAIVWGNADDMIETADWLEKIENSVIIPMYESKAKTETDWMELMKAETWMDAEQIAELFDVKRIENTKKVAACVDPEVMAQYRNVPDKLKAAMEPDETEEPDTSGPKAELAKTLLKMAL